jgi:hypothetical protein
MFQRRSPFHLPDYATASPRLIHVNDADEATFLDFRDNVVTS